MSTSVSRSNFRLVFLFLYGGIIFWINIRFLYVFFVDFLRNKKFGINIALTMKNKIKKNKIENKNIYIRKEQKYVNYLQIKVNILIIIFNILIIFVLDLYFPLVFIFNDFGLNNQYFTCTLDPYQAVINIFQKKIVYQ